MICTKTNPFLAGSERTGPISMSSSSGLSTPARILRVFHSKNKWVTVGQVVHSVLWLSRLIVKNKETMDSGNEFKDLFTDVSASLLPSSQLASSA
jgi:hypothetical protein